MATLRENRCTEKKNHTIHYLLRDHFSGLFYWEICSSDDLLPIYEFLYRAWSKRTDHPLYGIPDYMTVPQNVQVNFPNVLQFIEKIGISYLKVTSGFQGGVRDIRTIEDELRMVDFYLGDVSVHRTGVSLRFTPAGDFSVSSWIIIPFVTPIGLEPLQFITCRNATISLCLRHQLQSADYTSHCPSSMVSNQPQHIEPFGPAPEQRNTDRPPARYVEKERRGLRLSGSPRQIF